MSSWRTRASAALASAVLLGMSMPAWPASLAHAELTDLRVTLVDLAPADGIAPAIEFVDGIGLFGCASTQALLPVGTAPCTSGSLDVTQTGPNHALGSATGHGSAGLATVDLRALGGAGIAGPAVVTADGRSGGADGSYWGQVWAVQGRFTLTPHTLVVFAGDAALQAAVTGGVDIDGPWASSEWARAQAWLTASGTSEHQNQSFSDRLQAEVFASGPFVAADQRTAGGHLTAAFANLGATPMQGQAAIQLLVAGSSGVIPVPEPAGWAAWLAGLTLLARRRRERPCTAGPAPQPPRNRCITGRSAG